MPDTPRRGRPPAGGKGRPIRVDADTLAYLLEIAQAEGLTHCDMPSASKAVAWLVDRHKKLVRMATGDRKQGEGER